MRTRVPAVPISMLAPVSTGSARRNSAEAHTTPDRDTVIRYQGWAGQVSYSELAAALEYFDKAALESAAIATGGPQDIRSAATGATDMGGAFNGTLVELAATGSVG
ncbi:hypothetical protein [Nocardia sp. NPDC019395]|uniref:hypothetical protein n=1 Tax=Nocardia sp. NPDC019395 TaxID=3154686 RepID=UPI0033C27612